MTDKNKTPEPERSSVNSVNSVDFSELLCKGDFKQFLIQGLETLEAGDYVYTNPHLLSAVNSALEDVYGWEDDKIDDYIDGMFSA